MTDEDALVAGIRAKPKDDVRRLVYADWLEERDHAGGEYLRAEIELAKLGKRHPRKAKTLRSRMIELRSKIDPGWLARWDQPGMMRVNPSPFPAAWSGIDLPGVRDTGSTYAGYGYASLPPLPVDQFRGKWQWLLPRNHNPDRATHGNRLARMAKAIGLTLPAGFVRFANDTAAQSLIRSCTDCYFDWTPEIAESPLGDGGYLIRFYADSQGCLFWYVYATPAGYSCVVTSPNCYPDEFGDDEEDDDEGVEPLWFCAPSFEAFIYRTWIENEIWFRLADSSFDFHDPRPMTPEMQAYLDYHRRSG